MREKITCKKWACGEDGAFRCIQTDKLFCGCQSSIEYPLSISDILNDRQKQEREKTIADIKESIRNHQSALVLGAGISHSS